MSDLTTLLADACPTSCNIAVWDARRQSELSRKASWSISRTRKCLNLLESRPNRRWRAFHKSSKRVHDGEPNPVCPKVQSPVVDASTLRAPVPASRSIPNNANQFRTILFSAPLFGETVRATRRTRFLPFPPHFSTAPENARTRLTRLASRAANFGIWALVDGVCLARAC